MWTTRNPAGARSRPMRVVSATCILPCINPTRMIFAAAAARLRLPVARIRAQLMRCAIEPQCKQVNSGRRPRQAGDQFADAPKARLRSVAPSLSTSISAYPTSASGRLTWVNRSYQRGCDASPQSEPPALTVIASNWSPSRYVYFPFAARSALRTALIPPVTLLSASSSEPNSDAVQISQAGAPCGR